MKKKIISKSIVAILAAGSVISSVAFAAAPTEAEFDAFKQEVRNDVSSIESKVDAFEAKVENAVANAGNAAVQDGSITNVKLDPGLQATIQDGVDAKTGLTTLQTTVADNKAEVDQKIADDHKLIEQNSGKITTLEAKDAELEAKDAEIEGKVTTLENNTQDLTTKVGDLETFKGTTETKLGELDAKDNEIDGKVTAVEGRVGTLETSNGELTTKVGDLETFKGTTETKLGELDTKDTEIDGKVTKLEGKVTTLEGKKVTDADIDDNTISGTKLTDGTISSEKFDATTKASFDNIATAAQQLNDAKTEVSAIKDATEKLMQKASGHEADAQKAMEKANASQLAAADSATAAAKSATEAQNAVQGIKDNLAQIETNRTNIETHTTNIDSNTAAITELQNKRVTDADIDDNTISGSKLTNKTVTGSKIADKTITNDKLQKNSFKVYAGPNELSPNRVEVALGKNFYLVGKKMNEDEFNALNQNDYSSDNLLTTVEATNITNSIVIKQKVNPDFKSINLKDGNNGVALSLKSVVNNDDVTEINFKELTRGKKVILSGITSDPLKRPTSVATFGAVATAVAPLKTDIGDLKQKAENHANKIDANITAINDLQQADTALGERIDNVVTKNTEQDTRLTAVEKKDIAQDKVIKANLDANLEQDKRLQALDGKTGTLETKAGDLETGLGKTNDDLFATKDNMKKMDTRLNNRIDNVSKESNAGIASALATANIAPLPKDAKQAFGMGLGKYRNGKAIAMGVTGINNKGNMTYKVTGTYDNKHAFGIGMGLNIAFGKGVDSKVDNSELVNELNFMKNYVESLRLEIEALKMQVASK